MPNMDLILWRHADAEDGIPDEERRLTGAGLQQAQRMAAWLKQRLPGDVVILVSPARRARETAQAFSGEFNASPEVGTGVTPQSILAAAKWPHGKGAVLVVGHQPTLGQAAALVLTGRPAEWSLRKGAVWWLASRGEGEVVVRAVVAPDLA